MTESLVQQIGTQLQAQQSQLCTAESCTGGLIAAACTDVPGASAWFDRGFVTYSNEAKIALLDVAPELIKTEGAVSQACAEAMALGACRNSCANWSVATTGIAGPDGGTKTKPVGLVWFAIASADQVWSFCQQFSGDRAQVRQQATLAALTALQERVDART